MVASQTATCPTRVFLFEAWRRFIGQQSDCSEELAVCLFPNFTGRHCASGQRNFVSMHFFGAGLQKSAEIVDSLGLVQRE